VIHTLALLLLHGCLWVQDETGQWVEDKDQSVRLKANYIISAFGSGLTDENGVCTMM
jgi:hypothetical protein